MTARVYATLDPNRKGAGLVLDQGNLVVSCAGADVTYPADINRAVFGTIPIGSGTVQFECYFYSNLQASLANLCSVGIAEVGCSLSQYVGKQALSWGFRPAEAVVRNNDATISGAAAPAIQDPGERQCISVVLVQDAISPVCIWAVNGNPIFQAAITAGKFYVPAVSLGSSVAGDVSAYLNFGQRRFDYPTLTATI